MLRRSARQWGAPVVALVLALPALALGGASGGSPSGSERPAGEGSSASRADSDPAGSAARGRRAMRVRILTGRQARALRSGRLRVRVAVRRPGRVRLIARSGGRRVARTRRLGFRRAGARRVGLRLSPSGRRRLRGCRRHRVTVGATARAGPGRVRRAHARRRLRRDTGRCRAGTRDRPNDGVVVTPDGERIELSEGENEGRCDPIDPAVCLFPFPNDRYTVRDETTDSGRRLSLQLDSMPRNGAGKPIDNGEYNRNDGFSPGQMIVTKVPGLETKEAFERTGAVPITDMGRYADEDHPVVVINARTGQRHLIWAELDANPADPADVTLLIRPGVNFEEGGRYVVALRRLRRADGSAIPAEGVFRLYRDRVETNEDAIERRRSHMERLFAELAAAGIERGDLYRAWDFTVASERNLSERMLHIRDDAFAGLGDADLADMEVQGESPDFQVLDTDDFEPCSAGDPATCEDGEDPEIARRVEGRVLVPCYLDQPGCPPGSRFAYASDASVPSALPGNVHPANFVCNVPHAAVEGGEVRPARPSLYGHGLLGAADQVSGDSKTALANEHNLVMCATDWIGMACPTPDGPGTDSTPEELLDLIRNPPNSNDCDLANIATILADLSRFPTLVDRGQQGMLNFLFLGRAMIHPEGFGADPAFQFPDGGSMRSVIDTARLFYDGGSQGGILGGSLTAVAPDFDRAHLGVPGMNYSTLLRRSVDFDAYAQVLYEAYPNELERPLTLSLIQMIWDRSEANGYAHHMTTDPYPNTPRHEVILDMSFGDHQVANISTEVMARTVGASLRTPALDPSRSLDVSPYFGIPAIGGFPFAGSALVVSDVGPLRMVDGEEKGTNPPPPENVPNRAGVDPHGPDLSTTVEGRRLISEFLRVDGRVIDPCGGAPCYLDGYGGPD